MPIGQMRLGRQERTSALQRPPRPLQLKDSRCRDCRMQDSPADLSSYNRDRCPHNHDVVPTANRFSILAELDHKPKQATKWAFDFVQSSNAGPRKRRESKRGGRPTRGKYVRQQQQPDAHSADRRSFTEEICKKMTAFRVDDCQATQKAPSDHIGATPSSDAISTETIRHSWMPQFRPNSLSTPLSPPISAIPDLPQPPVACITKDKDTSSPEELVTEFKKTLLLRRPASLAAPDTAVRNAAFTALSSNSSALGNQLPIAMPTPAQKAAATAAHRALATRKAISPPLGTALVKHSSPQTSPSSLSHTTLAAPFSPPTPPPTPPTTAGALIPFPTLLPINPFTTASPTVTTPAALSPNPSVLPPPFNPWTGKLLSSQPRRTPPDLPPRPHLTPGADVVMPPMTVPKTTTKSSALSLITAPLPEPPRPFIKLPPPVAPPRIVPAVPLFKILPRQPAPISSAVQEELKEFLGMGHADQCWCSSHQSDIQKTSHDCSELSRNADNSPAPQNHAVPKPVPESENELTVSDLLSKHQRSASPDVNALSSHLSMPQRNFSDSSMESVILTPLLASPSASEWSDLGLGLLHLSTYADEHADDDWAFLSSNGSLSQTEDSMTPTPVNSEGFSLREEMKLEMMTWSDVDMTPPEGKEKANTDSPAEPGQKHLMHDSVPDVAPTSPMYTLLSTDCDSSETDSESDRARFNAEVLSQPTPSAPIPIPHSNNGHPNKASLKAVHHAHPFIPFPPFPLPHYIPFKPPNCEPQTHTFPPPNLFPPPPSPPPPLARFLAQKRDAPKPFVEAHTARAAPVTANTSAVEWPSLQDAAKMKRKRRGTKISGSGYVHANTSGNGLAVGNVAEWGWLGKGTMRGVGAG